MLKPHETCLKCKYQLKQMRATWEKCDRQKSTFRENWIWSFETLNSTFYVNFKNVEYLELKDHCSVWCHFGSSKNGCIRLLMLQFLRKLKLYPKLVWETARSAFTSKFICDHLYITIIYTNVFFTTGISHSHWASWSSIKSIAGVTCLTYCFSFFSVIAHLTPLLVFSGILVTTPFVLKCFS